MILKLLFRVVILTATICLLNGEIAAQSFIATDWSDGSLQLLDSNLLGTSSFFSGGTMPNGVTTDSSTIYAGHFSSMEVIAFDFNGTEQFRWFDSRLQNLQGMALVNGELAVSSDVNADAILFFDPSDGTFLRSIPSLGSTVEGIAFDLSLIHI